MIDVKKLIEMQLRTTKLEVLVFGPAVLPKSSDAHVACLQDKRIAIKAALIAEGYSALFGEDVVDPSLPAHLSDPLLHEVVAMRAADMIIVLVCSPGAIAEASTITNDKELRQKTQFFCFEEHKDGLVVKHLMFMADHGCACNLVTIADVQACHLTAAVMQKVKKVHVAKAFLS